jgi:hypothetical protein
VHAVEENVGEVLCLPNAGVRQGLDNLQIIHILTSAFHCHSNSSSREAVESFS